MLTKADIEQIKARGILPVQVEKQLEHFRQGFPPVVLDRPALVGDGIVKLDESRKQSLAARYEEASHSRKLVKFVPASGAATRMFKDLFSWRDKLMSGQDVAALLKDDPDAYMFFSRLPDFAFWDDLALAMDREELTIEHLLNAQNLLPVIDFLLYDQGLDYGALPKGLIAFHRYEGDARTAAEEHLAEGALYCRGQSGKVFIHFTVSPDHMDLFRKAVSKAVLLMGRTYNVHFDISYSIQNPSTDTIAVDTGNLPFRESGNQLVFRPGGHGALLQNLDALDADMVFIKNIDNVVPDKLKGPTILYKKVLGGLLDEIQQQTWHYIRMIENGSLNNVAYREAVDFSVNTLMIDSRVFPHNHKEGIVVLEKMLNRPIRVCGMVKNEGEPGGGPFWVKANTNGQTSLQIVESSQVNMGDEHQKKIFSSATHFNPVDLVCGLKDHAGKRFSLQNFVDPQTGFISKKSKDGRELKALELPGLWNGAMANWITIFVEVPIETFNPVKVVNDLLREQHQ